MSTVILLVLISWLPVTIGMAIYHKQAWFKRYFIFRWYDLYLGVYYDRDKRIAYVFPLPMLGIRIYLPHPTTRYDHIILYDENLEGWGFWELRAKVIQIGSVPLRNKTGQLYSLDEIHITNAYPDGRIEMDVTYRLPKEYKLP